MPKLKETKKYKRPSRIYIDQFEKIWSSKEVAQYYFNNKELDGMEFALIFTDDNIERLVQGVYETSIKANSSAESILRKSKKREKITEDERKYLYVAATRFNQAINEALVYEILHDTNVISDSAALYFAIAVANQNIRKAAKCKGFKKACGDNYNNEYWNRPDDIIRNTDVPGITRLERYLCEKKMVNINKLWKFYDKTELARNVIYYLKYKDIIPAGIFKNQKIEKKI